MINRLDIGALRSKAATGGNHSFLLPGPFLSVVLYLIFRIPIKSVVIRTFVNPPDLRSAQVIIFVGGNPLEGM